MPKAQAALHFHSNSEKDLALLRSQEGKDHCNKAFRAFLVFDFSSQVTIFRLS